VHNHYTVPGGEDSVFRAEREMLCAKGHAVYEFTDSNLALARVPALQRARQAVWSEAAYERCERIVRDFEPTLVHCHNTYAAISPSVLYAARRHGIPTVQTLHNYRMMCINGNLFRDSSVCSSCVGRSVPWPGVAHSCHRLGLAGSLAMAAFSATHHLLGTWRRAVSAYIVLSEFSKAMFLAAGVPAARMYVKPNFLPTDPGTGEHDGRFALYVGQLSNEKGVDFLLTFWNRFGGGIPLQIAGDGPLRGAVIAAAEQNPNIT
jgi:glycosyltransferase involved in cell wall biosynthesis